MTDRRSKDDKVFRGMWEAVETEAEEVRMAEAKEGRRKGGKGKKMRRRKRKNLGKKEQ